MRATGVALLLCALACGPAEPPRVVLLGDSITWGAVSGPDGPSFATLLEQALGPAAELHNVACGGLTVRVWLADATPAYCHQELAQPNLFEQRLAPRLPADVVVVLLGTNDSLRLGGLVEPDVYADRLRQLTRQLVERGAARVVLMAPPFINNKPKASMRLRSYGEAIAAMCEADPSLVCGPDLFELLEAGDFASNDLHPNARGHAKIATALEATLREITGLEVGPRAD